MARQSSKETLSQEEYYRKFEEDYDVEFVSPSDAVDALRLYVKTTSSDPSARQHFMFVGEPGGGKSAIVKQVSQEENIALVEVRISCSDEGIMVGCPTKTGEGSFRYSIDQNIKDKFEDAKAAGKKALVFFDEANRSKPHMINAMFNILDNKTWAGYKLPEDTLFCIAVNPATEMHTVIDIIREAALNRRFIIMGIEPSAKSLLAYADTKPRFHQTIKDFIRANPKSIMEIGKMNAGKKYFCPAILESLALRFTELEEQGYNLARIHEIPGLTRLIFGSAGKSGGLALLEFMQNRIRNISAEKILDDYASVRKIVQGGDGETDHGLVSTLAKQVAEYLASMLIDFSAEKSKAKNLAMFMDDLSDEVLRSFIANLHGAFTSNDQKNTYINKLTDALSSYDEFIRATKRMHSGYRKAEKAMERS